MSQSCTKSLLSMRPTWGPSGADRTQVGPMLAPWTLLGYLHNQSSNKAILPRTDSCSINTLRPRQNGRHFADDTFNHIFLNENVRISIKISLKFVPKGPFNNNSALVQIMAWRRPGDKPLSEPMMVRSLTHICVTRPRWVNQVIKLCISPTINLMSRPQPSSLATASARSIAPRE